MHFEPQRACIEGFQIQLQIIFWGQMQPVDYQLRLRTENSLEMPRESGETVLMIGPGPGVRDKECGFWQLH